MQNKNWTKEEIKFAYDNYKSKHLSIAGIGIRLGRTEHAVQTKLSEISVNGFDIIYNKAPKAGEVKNQKSKSIKVRSKSQIKVKTETKSNKRSFSLFWGLFKWN